MHLSSLTDREIISTLRHDNDQRVSELIKRIEINADQLDGLKKLQQKKLGRLLCLIKAIEEALIILEADVEDY